MGCICFSPLAQGLLTNKYLHGIPEDSRAGRDPRFLKPDSITEEKVSQIRDLNEMAQARGQSLAQMAIAWTLRHPVMTSALIGASKVSQVEDSAAAINNLDFADEELQKIEDILAR